MLGRRNGRTKKRTKIINYLRLQTITTTLQMKHVALLREFDIKVFGGIKTPEEKKAILIADLLIANKELEAGSIKIMDSIIKHAIKRVGVREAKKYLRENREDFEALLTKEKLNEIWLRNTQG